MSAPPIRLVGVDLGKTGCRARLLEHGAPGPVAETSGAAGLADPGGMDQAFAAVAATLPTVLAGAAGAVDALVVGAAGAESAPEQARALADRLSTLVPGAEVVLTSDSVTAHVGALAGAPGTVLSVGTGSVALGVSADGHRAQADGWGPWLGDDGSGAWIGRAALRAVLLAREGRGEDTALARRALERFGDLDRLPRTLHDSGSWARTTASFAPQVLAADEDGDRVAGRILDLAVRHWVDLLTAAADRVGEPRVCVVGGLASVAALRRRLETRLPGHLLLVQPAGTSLDGALLLGQRAELPHHAFTTRVGSAGGGRAATRSGVDGLATEQVRADLHDLDDRPPEDVVAELLRAEAEVPSALAAARPGLVAAVVLAGQAIGRGGRLLYVGAGTSGRLAALDAAECPPTFGTAPEQVVAVLAGGAEADRRAMEGAEDDAEAGARDLGRRRPGPGDVVVGVTASGRTPYVLGALAAARAAGARTVAVVNNPGGPAASGADVAVELLTGPEVVAGSTRLKAGSAQKVVLNVLSTGAMVLAGRTYGPWMVDVVAANDKLRARARRILREATGVDDERAQALLEEAQWHPKTALVAQLGGVDVRRARELLEAAGGRARTAIESCNGEVEERPWR